MALLKYREAIADCTVSLRIHSHYMKAMLRRSRCYVRLSRFDEAQAEYERYIKLVESARDPTTAASSNFDCSPCVFDGPKDVKDSDLASVQEELNEVKRAKINAENTKRREEVERQNRQNWYQETFGQSQPGDAERRREEWYSQQGRGSRRWDSFNGRGPNPQGNSSRQSETFRGAGSSARNAKSYRAEQPRQEQPRQGSRRQDERKENVFGSPGSDTSICHYKALGISPTATDVEIKRAYKMAALKYHPDKNQETGATDMFRRVKLAYDVLKDPTQKREYDTQLRWNRRY
jgi:curved DNA-binding protein CbpA